MALHEISPYLDRDCCCRGVILGGYAVVGAGNTNGTDAASACEDLIWTRDAQKNIMSDQDFEKTTICAGIIRGVNTMLRNNCITPPHGSV